MISSIAGRRPPGAGADKRVSSRLACRRCAPPIIRRVGVGLPHGPIAPSTPLQDTPSWHRPFSHGVVSGRRRRPLVGSRHFHLGNDANFSSAFSTARQIASPGLRKSVPKRGGQPPSGEHSFQRIVSANNRKATKGISPMIATLLSDINLRHDENTRSILRKHGNQYLPLYSIKFTERFASDPSWVLEAINVARDDYAMTGQSSLLLDVEETDDGEIFVKRTPPFDYAESVRKSHRNMMVIDGWPTKGETPLWVGSLIRLLLRNGEDGGQIPLAYWRSDKSRGVLNIEFESKEGATGAWRNLERAASQVDLTAGSSGYGISVRPQHSDQQNGSYQIQIGGCSLVARSIEMSTIEEESLSDQETMNSKRNLDAIPSTKISADSFDPRTILSERTSANTVEDSSPGPGAMPPERTLDAIAPPDDRCPAGPEPRGERERTVQDLSKRLSFFLSDIHLRHNEYARSVLLHKREDQYLPLNSIKSFERFIGDSSIVLDAVNFCNEAIPPQGKSHIRLDMKETEDGEVLVGRSPPFDHAESVLYSHKKMMVVDGWPKGPKPRWAKSLVYSLLCSDGASLISTAYWRFDNSKGVLKIEFQSAEDAMSAWDNLERATRQVDSISDSSGHKIEVRPTRSEEQNGSYRLEIDGDISLVARPIEVPSVNRETGLELTPEAAISHAEGPTVRETSSAAETSADAEPATLAPSVDDLYGSYQKLELPETLSLSQFSDIMDHLYQEHVKLPLPSREWLYENARRSNNARSKKNAEENEELQRQLFTRRRDICDDVENVISCVEASIRGGKIRALGPRDGYSLTDSLGRAMLIYSEIPYTTDDGDDAAVSPYEACLDVFDLLRRLNLDTHPSHFSYAIRAACHERRWGQAVKLFLDQIDGSDNVATGGFVPISPALGWNQPLEIGLYAVARHHESKTAEEGRESNGVSPSKEVFDTAMRMCMVSPAGQENYILAAGLALGRAGLWRDCLDFATSPDSASSYGPSTAAATMLACIECSRYPDAIQAYDFFMCGSQSAASEWQWGGGNVTATKPLCRDLALSAMGNMRRGGFGSDAMLMFGEIMKEDCPLSAKALFGLGRSLMHDGDLESSIQLLKGFLDSVYRKERPKWRMLSNALDLNKNEMNEANLTQSEENELLADILSSVMRVCNHRGQYGLAILLCSIVNDSYISEKDGSGHGLVECKDDRALQIILSQQIVTENQQVLNVYISSLYQLGCGHTASGLLNILEDGSSAPTAQGLRGSGLPHAESWSQAYIAIDRVLKASNAIISEGSNVPPNFRMPFERGLGRAMDHCIDSNQPSAALYLFNHAMATVTRKRKDTTLAERVKTFFGMENPSDYDRMSGTIFQSDDTIDLKSLRLSDSLLAAIIKAHTHMGEQRKAQSAFYDGIQLLDDPSLMTQSANNTLEALLDIDINECLSFLDTMDEKCLNPSTFLAIARHYASNKIWPEVGEVYNRARKAGCISEDLALITMQAVCESELLDRKIVVLRNIIGDVSSLVGMKRDDWIRSKYWGIKRYVGFHYARLLMRWNDPATSQKEELLFAINEMRQCASEGIATKNAPLECITKIAQVYGTDGKVENKLSEKQRLSAVNLILEACVEADRSGLMKKYSFTAEVARSLRALKANTECIRLVLTIISPGKKCRHRVAMEEAMYAALEERDHEALELIADVFELSGFDSRQLSI